MMGVAFLVTVLVIVFIMWLSVHFSKSARVKRERAQLLKRHEHLISAKVRLGRGQRFDCPACGSTSPCGRCRLRCYHGAQADRGTDSKDLRTEAAVGAVLSPVRYPVL